MAPASAATPFAERLQAAFAQVQSQATTADLVPIVATLVVGLLTLILVARVIEDYMSKGAETFYPTKAHSRVLSYKLVTSAMSKGKKWQRDVQKPGFQLCDRVLSARLPLAPREQHVADMIRVCELPAPPTHLPIIYPAVLMGECALRVWAMVFGGGGVALALACGFGFSFWALSRSILVAHHGRSAAIANHICIVSILAPHTVYPNCLLFAKPEYPFPAMGSVHVSNFTKIYKPLPVDEEYPATIKVWRNVCGRVCVCV
jgi:hypothetical protein